MYLIIDEGNTIRKTQKINGEDLACADDGIMTVIDISCPDTPKDYYGGEWHNIGGNKNEM